jgi:hypothetical protein
MLTKGIESRLQPETNPPTARCPHCQQPATLPADNPPPPPYSAQLCAEAQWAEEEKLKMWEIPSISEFAICTALAIANIIAMVLLWFSIQNIVYCLDEMSSQPTPIQSRQFGTAAICLWLMYAVIVAWASNGTLCWAKWLCNLWGGPYAAERWPIDPDTGVFIVLGVLLAPLVLGLGVVMGISMGLWEIGKGLRRYFRGKPGTCNGKGKREEPMEMERPRHDRDTVTEEEDGEEK